VFDSLQGKETFLLSSPQFPDNFRAQIDYYPVDNVSFLPGVKQPDREADRLPLSSDKVKSAWSCTCNSPHAFK
jgi:hypothetical protein